MKLSCNQDNLSRGLNVIGKIIGTRGNLPVLNNVLLATDKGRLKLASTDLEIGINTWIGAKIDEDGKISVPAKLLIDFVNTNTDLKINFESKNDSLDLNSTKYKANIKGINASEFPLIPTIDKNMIAEINAVDFQKAIAKTIFAAAMDETRPVLTGVLLSLDSNNLKLAATDSYRLAEAKLNLVKGIKKKAKIIVPARTLSEISRITTIINPTKVKIFLSENQVSFILADTQIVSRLIEGNYPDYQQIIPEKYSSKITVSVRDFANALKMASIFARESANNIKFLTQKNNKAQISAISPQVGEATSEVSLIDNEGEELEIAFNAKYILDTINVIEDKNLIIEANGSAKPATIKSAKTKDFLYIIMPLRIDEP